MYNFKGEIKLDKAWTYMLANNLCKKQNKKILNKFKYFITSFIVKHKPKQTNYEQVTVYWQTDRS